MRHFARLVFLAALCSAAAPAAIVDWMLTGTLTGSLGASNFTDAAFTMIFQVDTTQVTQPSGGVYHSAVGLPGSITITGTGTGNFNSGNLVLFSNTNNSVGGLGINFSSDLLDFTAPGLATWTMSTPFAAESATATFVTSGQIGTDAGLLTFGGTGSANNLIFSASLEVPEPVGFGLMGLGLAATAVLRFFHSSKQ